MLKRTSLPLFVVLAMVASVGCGGGGNGGDQESAPGHGSTGGTGAERAAGGAGYGTSSVSGTVAFEGDAPAATTVKMDADPFCTVQHADGATKQKFEVNAAGGLKWAFVYVKEGLTSAYEPVAQPVVLDQKGCTYEPHVFGIMAGQDLSILNSDATLHNIHSLAKNSREFNLAMPRAGMEIKQKFRKPEVMVRIKCDVHPWMESWAGVLDHPFHAVTGDDGTFSLDRLPAGTYTIEAWHPTGGTHTQTVTVGEGEAQQIAFTFTASS